MAVSCSGPKVLGISPGSDASSPLRRVRASPHSGASPDDVTRARGSRGDRRTGKAKKRDAPRSSVFGRDREMPRLLRENVFGGENGANNSTLGYGYTVQYRSFVCSRGIEHTKTTTNRQKRTFCAFLKRTSDRDAGDDPDRRASPRSRSRIAPARFFFRVVVVRFRFIHPSERALRVTSSHTQRATTTRSRRRGGPKRDPSNLFL